MLDWNAAKEAVRQALIEATGIAATSVVWGRSSEAGTWIAWPLIELQTRTVKAWDDSEEYSAAPNGDLVTTLSGPRMVKVQVKVVSDDANTGESVTVVSERLRTRLYRGKVLNALKDAGVGVGAMGPSIDIPYAGTNGRAYSASITEIDFNLVSVDVDTTASGDYIERVTYKSKGGSELPPFTLTVRKPNQPLARFFPLTF